MVDHSERCSTSSTSTSTRWVAWMPLLFVSAFLYWSVALGLGGLSLLAVTAISGDMDRATMPDYGATALEPVPGHALGDTIVVHLEESAEPEDVNDNAGAVAPNDSVDTVDSADPAELAGSQADSRADNNDGTGRLPAQSR
jgi:hypothetical protein